MIKEIKYNWRQAGDHSCGLGEDYDVCEVGRNGVTDIVNVTPDRDITGYTGNDFYDVIFEDGSVMTIFNPNLVTTTP